MSDPEDSTPDRLVFNRTVALRDTWTKADRPADAAAGGAPAGGRTPAAERVVPDLSAEEHRRRREAAAPDRSAELEARRRRFEAELGLGDEEAELLTRERATADFFEAALDGGAAPRRVANWVINELPREIGDRTLAGLPFSGADFGALVALVDDGTLSGTIGREVLAEMLETGSAPGVIVDRRGLRQIADPGALEPVVARIVAASPDRAEAFRNGRTGLMGYFMGQVMKETGGRANPELAKRLLEEALRA